MKKKSTNYFSFLLALTLLISFIFGDKEIYLAPSLIVSVSTFIYPFTFLFVALIYKKYKVKEAKESIVTSALVVILFFIVASLLCSLNGTTDTQLLSDSLRKILTPNHFKLYDIVIYYPNLLKLLAGTAVFVITHYVFIALYDAVESYSNYFVAFMLAILISYIIDQMFFVPIISLPGIWKGELSFVDIIKLLTSNFFMVVASSVFQMFVYPICLKEKN